MILWLYQSIFTAKYAKFDFYRKRKNVHHKFQKFRPFFAKRCEFRFFRPKWSISSCLPFFVKGDFLGSLSMVRDWSFFMKPTLSDLTFRNYSSANVNIDREFDWLNKCFLFPSIKIIFRRLCSMLLFRIVLFFCQRFYFLNIKLARFSSRFKYDVIGTS